MSQALGGGDGYRATIDRSQADYEVASIGELRNALQSAGSNDIVYVVDDIELHPDDTGEDGLVVDCTLASDRGIGGSPGQRLYTNHYGPSSNNYRLQATGNARITGLRIEGTLTGFMARDGEPYPVDNGIRLTSSGAEVDNCEIYGWRDAGIKSDGDNLVHHSYFHDNAQDGLGYGVVAVSGTVEIEWCRFNRNRHSVAANARDCEWHIRNCWFGPEHYSHVIDHHGPTSSTDLVIQNCTNETTNQPDIPGNSRQDGGHADFVDIRDSLPGSFRMERTWTYHNSAEEAIDIRAGSVNDATLIENHYGSSDPGPTIGHPRGGGGGNNGPWTVAFVTGEASQNTPDTFYTYNMTVDGSVSKSVAPGSTPVGNPIEANSNDTVDTRTDGTTDVNGQTGDGFGDAFTVYGPVTEVSISDPDYMWIELNGQEVTPEELMIETGGMEPPEPSVSVDSLDCFECSITSENTDSFDMAITFAEASDGEIQYTEESEASGEGSPTFTPADIAPEYDGMAFKEVVVTAGEASDTDSLSPGTVAGCLDIREQPPTRSGVGPGGLLVGAFLAAAVNEASDDE